MNPYCLLHVLDLAVVDVFLQQTDAAGNSAVETMLAGKVGEQLVEFRLIGLMLGLILGQVEVGGRPNPASCNGMDNFSINSLGIVVFRPTSIPTIHRIPKKSIRILASLHKANVEANEASCPSPSSLPGIVVINQMIDNKVVTE